jgi:hypothetical protein
MRTECKTIYSINELSDEAKENALQKWSEKHEYFSGHDILSTLEKGVELFGFKLRDYLIDYASHSNSYIREEFIRYDHKYEIFELTGKRLYSYLVGMTIGFLKTKVYSLHANGKKQSSTWAYKYDGCVKKRFSRIFKVDESENCPLTGVCYDYNFLDPLVSFLKNPNNNTTFKELFDDCVDSLFVAMEKDYESELTMEYFEDHAEANEYEFYEDGTWYK